MIPSSLSIGSFVGQLHRLHRLHQLHQLLYVFVGWW